MALFSNSPPVSGQIGLNHANGVTEDRQLGGIACVAYNGTPPRYSADLPRL
jgi:hypothetical protein